MFSSVVMADHAMPSVYVRLRIMKISQRKRSLISQNNRRQRPQFSFRQMMRRREATLRRRQREREIRRAKYGDLFNTISAILFAVDPMGINTGSNSDEYEVEVGSILPRLEGVDSVEQVDVIVRKEFARWFSEDDGKPSRKYTTIAEGIWEAWCASGNRKG